METCLIRHLESSEELSDKYNLVYTRYKKDHLKANKDLSNDQMKI